MQVNSKIGSVFCLFITMHTLCIVDSLWLSARNAYIHSEINGLITAQLNSQVGI